MTEAVKLYNNEGKTVILMDDPEDIQMIHFTALGFIHREKPEVKQKGPVFSEKDLLALTKDELLKLAKEHNIPADVTKPKADIVKALLATA